MEKYLDRTGVLRLLKGVKDQINNSSNAILDTKGKPNGIASLDENGFIPFEQFGNLDTTLFEIVSELPTRGIKKHIYLTRNEGHADGKDLYTEYIYTGNVDNLAEDYDEKKWEELGSFAPDFDLADYVRKADAIKTGSISFKVSEVEGNTTLSLVYTDNGKEVKETLVEIPIASTSSDGLMTARDKGKLDNIDLDALEASINNANQAADNTNAAIANAERATSEAENVNAELTDDNVFKVTDRHANVKELQLYDQASINTKIDDIESNITGILGGEDSKVDTGEVNLKTVSDDVKAIIGNADDAEDNIDTAEVNLKSISKKVTEITGAIGDADTDGTIKKDIATINETLETKANKDIIKTEINDSDDEVPTSKAVKTELDAATERISTLEASLGDESTEGSVKNDIKKLQDEVSALPKFVHLTENEYNGKVLSGEIDENTYYMISET